MAAGRRPIPTATKALSGKRDRNPNKGREPQFGGQAKCPPHLDKVAKAEWKRVATHLSDQGLLTAVDQSALAAYCAAYSRWVNAEKNVQQFGAVIKSPTSGFPIQNPYVGVANTALQMMHRFCTEFGMTPSSRTKIGADVPPPSSGDPFVDYMRSIGGDEAGAEVNFNDDEAETHIRAKNN